MSPSAGPADPGPVAVAGHAYPWDVIGDPAFPGRVFELGMDTVVLAAAYHSVRAATPFHPRHQVVEARWAALYRPVRARVWAGRRLRPGTAPWVTSAGGPASVGGVVAAGGSATAGSAGGPVADPYGTAAAALRDAGLRVEAWVVLLHNTRLGLAHPDLAVVNCFGEPYPYALCPSHAEVRDYAALLAREALRDAPVDGVSLEACGQLGLTHGSHHEKTDGAWTPEAARWLSICCCPACRTTWHTRGLNPEEVTATLRQAVQAVQAVQVPSIGERGPAGASGAGAGGAAEAAGGALAVGRRGADGGAETAGAGGRGGDGGAISPELAAALLAARAAATDALRDQVLEEVRGTAPGTPVTLHAHPDPWATGAAPGLTVRAAATADALLVPAWPSTLDGADVIAETVAATAEHGTPVDAYLTVLPPADPAELPAHAARVRAAGATRLNLYHLGLAGPARAPLLRTLATTKGEIPS